MAKPSRDMLTTGLVGSYLLASAWGILLLGAVLVLFAGTTGDLDMGLGATFGGFAVVAGLLWLGGAICEAVGWIGLARLYPGLPSWIGWLEGSLPVVTLVAFVVVIALLDFDETAAHLMVVLQFLHFSSAALWMATHGPRGLTLPAALGYGLAIVGGGILYGLALGGAHIEVMGLVLLVTLLAGGTIGHLATGIFFGRSRVLADSVNTF